MKFTGIVTILLAAAATAMPTTAETAATAETAYIPQQESQDWKSCTNDLLADFRRGTPPVKASCNMWDCLHRQASRYHRGGGIATVSNALDPICIGGNIISGIPVSSTTLNALCGGSDQCSSLVASLEGVVAQLMSPMKSSRAGGNAPSACCAILITLQVTRRPATCGPAFSTTLVGTVAAVTWPRSPI